MNKWAWSGSLCLAVLGLMAGLASADPIWTIGEFDNSYAEFDLDPHDDPIVAEYRIGDPFDTFPFGLGTDIGSQDSTINIRFDAVLDVPSIFTICWSPGQLGPEQFEVLLNGVFVANSPLRVGTIPAEWTTDTFNVPAATGTEHVLTLRHLLTIETGHGTWHDALQLAPLNRPSFRPTFERFSKSV